MRDFPEVGGIVGMFRDAIISISRSEQKDMALGGAIAIAGALTSNRFSLNGHPVKSSMYVMNVASTGSGKGAIIDFANSLFGPMGVGSSPHHILSGLRNYSSDVAIIANLSEQRARLDIIDEFGQVFKGLATKGDRKSAVGECLKDIYSVNGHFKGHYTKTNGWVGGCVSPAISIIGSIQPQTLINNASNETLFDGFMGRFMYFMENIDVNWLGNQLDGGLANGVLDHITKACLEAYPENPLIDKDMVGNLIEDKSKQDHARVPMKISNAAYSLIREMDHEHYNDMRDKRLSGLAMEAALYARSIEMAQRLSNILCISDGRRTVDVNDLFLAKDIVYISIERSMTTLLASGSSKERQNSEKILKIVENQKLGQVRRNEALRHSHLSKKEFDDAVSYLVAAGKLDETEIDTGAKNGRKTKYLTLAL